MRGEAMTRTEVFVDAAFAFAVTLLVISFDAIPSSYPEMVTAFKTIPAFVAAVAQLVWFWHTHTVWCDRYGLDDGPTAWLSALLLVVVLIFIYPMRVMLEAMFAWLTDGYLPTAFVLTSIEELRYMFIFMSVASGALCLTFVALYGYAKYRAEPLRLNAAEKHKTTTMIITWAGCAVIVLSMVPLALVLSDYWVQFTGFVSFLIGAWVPWVQVRRRRLFSTIGKTQ